VIGIDANVLVRVLVEDAEQPHQTQLARALVRSAPQVYISQIVQVETVWVLESAYQFDKASIIQALEQLSQNEACNMPITFYWPSNCIDRRRQILLIV